MTRIYNLPKIVPWFIYDIDNQQLITSPIVPGDITDTKGIVFAEIQIPGLDHQPIQSGGMGNRKINFTLQIIKRDEINGNIALLKQFDSLRYPKFSLRNVFQKSTQFTPNPKVLYYWGTGSIPLVWYVSKCDFVHKGNWNNSLGVPKYSEVSIELILDESNPLNKGEAVYRQMAGYVGNVDNIIQETQSRLKRRPY